CTGTSAGTVIAVYTGSSFATMTRVTDNDDSCGSQSSLSLSATSGTQYDIQVDTYSSATPGSITLSWSPPLPTLSINNVTANEGNSGTTNFTFTVTLSASSASTVTV